MVAARVEEGSAALRLLAGAVLLTGFGLTAHTVHANPPTYTVVTLSVNTTADDPTATCGTPGAPPVTPPHISGPCSLRGVALFANGAGSAGHYYVVNATVPAHTYLIDPAQGPIIFSNGYTKTHLYGGAEYTTILDGQNATEILQNLSNLTISQMTF